MRRGFTLVEVLVVVAVVMVLVSLLLPVIKGAREAAYLAYCTTELQNLGQAYHAYAIDYNDGVCPQIRYCDNVVYNGRHFSFKGTDWTTLLKPYGRKELEGATLNNKVKGWVQCPKFPTAYDSYSQSHSVGFRAYQNTVCNTRNLHFSQMRNPRTLLLVAEKGHIGFNENIVTYLGKYSGQPGYNVFPTVHYGKRVEVAPGYSISLDGMGNFLFCDGHVEAIHTQRNWLKMAENIFGQ